MAVNMSDMPLLAMLKQRMSWLSARQNVLAQNVANADTPGYTARYLKPINFEDILQGTTTPSQLAGLGGPPAKWSPSSGVNTKSVRTSGESIRGGDDTKPR